MASAVGAQVNGVAALVGDNERSDVANITVVQTFDDASMWVSDPATKADRLAGIRTEGAKIAGGKLWRRGRNVSLPVLTMTEFVGARRVCQGPDGLLSSDFIRGHVVASPSQVLPKANTGTILNRWRRWYHCGIAGAGAAVDPDGVLDAAIRTENRPWKTVCVTKDNLGLNLCIAGQEESLITQGLELGVVDKTNCDTFFHLGCGCHSAVLCTKDPLDRQGDFLGGLVRMGHLHESGKVANEHSHT